jgi:hypothetical protein
MFHQSLSNQEQVCVDFYEIHWFYVNQYGMDGMTQECKRIYKRGEEIINEMFDAN